MNKRIVTSWSDLIEIEREYSNTDDAEFIFRGQVWPADELDHPIIRSSIERACLDLAIPMKHAGTMEKKLIREFVSASHLYGLPLLPSRGETLEWLSLMRHFGTPTRLVDFTWSIYVACFFACEDMKNDSALCIVNKTWLSKKSEIIIRRKVGGGVLRKFKNTRDGGKFRKMFIDQTTRFVFPTNPLHLNSRLAIQQGLFLAPGVVTVPFEDNLNSLPGRDSNVHYVRIARGNKPKLMLQLLRLNITRATLYPELEGFAKSLRDKLLLFNNPRELAKSDIELENL